MSEGCSREVTENVMRNGEKGDYNEIWLNGSLKCQTAFH